VRKSLLPLIAALAVGCAWVPLTEDGAKVTMISSNEVITCERVGNTKAAVLRKVWFVPRPKASVARELETLARNEGAKLGGNTVTPLGQEKDGHRSYAVYVCED
jgi:hypothetical protein